MPQTTPLKFALAYLGVIPFAVFLFMSIFPEFVKIEGGLTLFVYYSVIIVNFVAGSLWHLKGQWLGLPIALNTNIVSLLSFLCLLLPIDISLALLMFSFSILLLMERKVFFRLPSSHNTPYLTLRSSGYFCGGCFAYYRISDALFASVT